MENDDTVGIRLRISFPNSTLFEDTSTSFRLGSWNCPVLPNQPPSPLSREKKNHNTFNQPFPSSLCYLQQPINIMATINVAKRKVVVFSGGSAANSLVDVFDEVIEKNNCALTYVIPISDNGGSSSEILRVFGGPGIGDVRSRLAFLLYVVLHLFSCLYRFSFY